MKKIVSLTLMSILCLTLFTGCGEPKNLSAEDIANKMKESGLPICNINDDEEILNKRDDLSSFVKFIDNRLKNKIETYRLFGFIEVYMSEEKAIERQTKMEENASGLLYMYRYKNELLSLSVENVPKEAAEEYGEVFLDVCKKGKAKYKAKYSAEKQDTSNSTVDSQDKKVEINSIVDSLDKLNDLKEKGTISDEEYEKLKKELLK